MPKSGRLPPQGAIAAGVLPNTNPTKPRRASRSTVCPATPKWCELATATATVPVSATAAMAAAMPASSAG